MCMGRQYRGAEYPEIFEKIQKWNISFRRNHHFTRYNHRSRKSKLPPLLFDNPEETISIKEFFKNGLDGLSIEKDYYYINDFILPSIAVKKLEDGKVMRDEVVQYTKLDLLRHYGLHSFSISTAWRWMKVLGMRYCEGKKNYYVDGHERDDVVLSRWMFIKGYFAKENRMHRWIQLDYSDAEACAKKKR